MSVGRGVFFRKRMVEECYDLDMALLRKRIDFNKIDLTSIAWTSSWGRKLRVFIIHKPKEPFIIFYQRKNRQTGQNEVISYKLPWEATPCNYGGFRYWFLCPSCHSRRRVLYLPYESKYFACRKCYNLCYESQQEGKSFWWALMKGIKDLPKWEKQYYRARSPKKKARLDRKIMRIYNMIRPRVYGRNRR